MHPSLVTMPLNTRCDKQGFWTGKVQIYNKFYSKHCSRGVTTNFFKASSSKTNMAIIHNQNFLTESCTYFVCVFLLPFSPNILTFAYRIEVHKYSQKLGEPMDLGVFPCG